MAKPREKKGKTSKTMGMSSSQARLLTLTARMHDIEFRAQRIQAEKLRLANESDKVYNTYLEALDASKIQYKSINNKGEIEWVDATLNALENRPVPTYTGCTSNDTFLLYDGTRNKILVTPSFAEYYGITESSAEEIGTLDEWLYAHGCRKAPVPDTYSINGGLSNSESIQAGSTYYAEEGTPPTVTSNIPTTTPITNYTTLLKTTDPSKTYTVSSADELIKLSQIINNGAETDGVTIILASDITIPAGTTFNTISSFKGTFNGNGHKISNLNNALFETLNGATISNLEISNSTINATYNNAGTLANSAINSTISNIKASGTVSSTNGYVGGLIGTAINSSTISNSYFNGSVGITTGSTATKIGGLIGYGEGITVTSCKTEGSVKGYNSVGGFIGSSKNISIINSITTSAVTSTKSDTQVDTGGFAGNVFGTSTIEYCSSSGQVNTQNYYSVGGFIGSTGEGNNITIRNSVSHSNIVYANARGTEYIGTLIGDAYSAHVFNCDTYGTINSSTSNCAFYTKSNSNRIKEISSCYNAHGITGNSTPSGSPNNPTISYVAPNLTTSSLPTATTVSDIPLETTTIGTLTVNGSNDKLCKYIGFLIGGADNYIDTYNTIKDNSYDTYQLAELVELAKTGSYTSLDDLTSDLTNKYNSTDYNLSQMNIGDYNVIQKHNPNIKQVNVSNTQDIVNRLAYDIYSKNNGGDITSIQNQIRSNFSDNQLASLSYYYGKNEWNTIVNNLASNINASNVEEYTERYDSSWTINYTTANTVNIAVIKHPDEWIKDANYYTQYNKYYELKALQDYTYEIVDEDLASQVDFVSNWITEGGASLLQFSVNDDGTFNLKDTSVAVDTSLQEIANEKNLKKAEAQYEADMKRIDRKDARYDAQLAVCDNERNAVKAEMETLKNVAKDNVDRTFKLFS